MVTTSVILPVYNEAKFMHIALTSLNEQTRPYDELIIVNNESTDNSVEVAKTYTNKVFSAPRGKLNALQVGISMASGEVILTIDSDCWYPPDYIERMLKYFENPNIVLVIGDVYLDETTATINSLLALANWIGYHLMKHGLGAARAFRRESFMQINGFIFDVNQFNVVSISSEEEMFFHRRLATLGQIIYDPSILIHHRRSRQFICGSCEHQAEGICEYCGEIHRGERF